MADTVRNIRINAYTEGAVQGLQNMNEAINTNNQNLDENKNRVQNAGNQFEQYKRKAEEAVRGIHAASQALLDLNQRYQLLGTQGTRAVQGIEQLTSRLSEQGLAAGAVSLTIEMMAEAWASAGWIERRTQNVSDLTRTMDELRRGAQEYLALEQRQSLIGKDLNATQVELLAVRARAEAVGNRARELMDQEITTGRNLSVQINQRTREYARLRAEQQTLEQQTRDLIDAQESERNLAERRERAARAEAAATERQRRIDESWDRYQAAIQEIEQRRLQRSADLQTKMNLEREGALLIQRQQQELDERTKEQQEEFHDNQMREFRERRQELSETTQIIQEFNQSWQSGLENVIETFSTTNRQMREHRVAVLQNSRLIDVGLRAIGNSVLESIGGNFTQAFSQAVAASITGAEDFGQAMEKMASAVLNALLQESIVQVIVETARGIASLASYQYDAAALHFAAAATWGAVGIGAGIGAAALSAGSASQNSSVPSSPSSGTGMNRSEREKAGNTYNITIQGNMIGTKKDAARYIQNSLERYAS